MNVGLTFRKLVKAAAVAVALLPLFAQAFIPLPVINGAVYSRNDAPPAEHVLRTERGHSCPRNNGGWKTPAPVVHAIVDETGTIVNRYAYSSFGVIDWDYSHEGVANRYAFQGREYDAERGDYYFRNRLYFPEWGLFSGPDMNLAAGPYAEAHGMMSYVFCANDPWTYADPLGLDSMRAAYWYEKGISGAFWKRRNLAVYNAAAAHEELACLVEEHKSYMNDHAPWVVAGSVNSVLDITGGCVSMPLRLMNFGSGSGEFAGAVDNYGSGNGTLLDVGNAVPILGSVGENLGTSTWDVWENPGLETGARVWGAYGAATLTVLVPIQIKKALFDGPRISSVDKPASPVGNSQAVSPNTTHPRFLEYKTLRSQGCNASEAHGLMKQFDAGANSGGDFLFHFADEGKATFSLANGIPRTDYGFGVWRGFYTGTTPTPNAFLKNTTPLGWGVPGKDVRMPIRVTPEMDVARTLFGFPLKTRIIRTEGNLRLSP